MTGKQTFEKIKNCRIMDTWLLGPSTVPWTIEFDKTNCVGRFQIKNTIKNISSLFSYSKIWWNTIKILECEPDSGSDQRFWFKTIFNWYRRSTYGPSMDNWCAGVTHNAIHLEFHTCYQYCLRPYNEALLMGPSFMLKLSRLFGNTFWMFGGFKMLISTPLSFNRLLQISLNINPATS